MKNKKGVLLAVKQYGRRSRPRAKSLDSPCMSGDENFAIERNRSTENVQKNPESDHESDQLMPLMVSKEPKITSYTNRSYSLDSNPQYQFILYGTSVPFLTSGYSVSLKPSKQNSLVTMQV